ncbi:MAG: ATP-binding cassette domain-containing protein, partial [Nocardioidaceae bacterium]
LRLHALVWNAGGRYRLEPEPLVVRRREVAVVVAGDRAATALADVVVGLARPVRGTVRLDDEDITELAPERRGVGLVPVDGGLLPHQSVERNIAVGRHDRIRPRKIAGELHLGDVLTAYPHALSPAQRLQAAVARALCRRPEPDAIVIEDRTGRTPCRVAVATALARDLAVLVITDDRDRVATLGGPVHLACPEAGDET